MDFLWNWLQQRQIQDASSRAAGARSFAEQESQSLERKIDSLLLVNAAMWSILREKLG